MINVLSCLLAGEKCQGNNEDGDDNQSSEEESVFDSPEVGVVVQKCHVAQLFSCSLLSPHRINGADNSEVKERPLHRAKIVDDDRVAFQASTEKNIE